MVINQSKESIDQRISRIIEEIQSDTRSSSEVLKELLLLRFATFLSKSDDIDKVTYQLKRMLKGYSKGSEFIITLKSVNEIHQTMKRILNLIINPREIRG